MRNEESTSASLEIRVSLTYVVCNEYTLSYRASRHLAYVTADWFAGVDWVEVISPANGTSRRGLTPVRRNIIFKQISGKFLQLLFVFEMM